MRRVQLDMPTHFPYATDCSVRIGDINYGNHLGHDAYMQLMHEARLRMLAEHGFSEMDVGGCGLIMTDTQILFRSEVLYPATLRCQLAMGDWTRTGFAVYYRLTRAQDDGTVVAEACTGMVCYDYTRKRPARVPESFRRLF